MYEQAEIDKFIRTGITLGSLPNNTDKDFTFICDISFEQILCGFIKDNTLMALQSFPLFKVSDNITLEHIVNNILQNKLGYSQWPTNARFCSWQWHYTTVPSAFFSIEAIPDLLGFQYVNLAPFEPKYDVIDNELMLLYALPAQWKRIDKYPFYHTFTSVLKTLIKSEVGKEATVWAYIHNQSLALFYINDNKLIFSNSFTPRTQQDYVYYIMLLYNQLKINASNVPLKFMGEVQPQSALCDALSRYLRYVQFAEYKSGIALHPDISAQPSHYYYGLYALAECVLSAAH